jgi:hypothetical protein
MDVQQPCHLPRRESWPEQFDGVGVKDRRLSDHAAGRPSFDPSANATSHRHRPKDPLRLERLP